jgi:uncharacterized membrane protein YdjX (TVP38/TMEM64 family)
MNTKLCCKIFKTDCNRKQFMSVLGLFTWTIITGILTLVFGEHIFTFADRNKVWFVDNEFLGSLFYMCSYTLGVITFIPLPIYPIFSGFIYSKIHGKSLGLFIGCLVCYVSLVFANTLVFFVSRYCFRRCIKESLIDKNRMLRAVTNSIMKKQLRTMIMMRLQPLFHKTIVVMALGCTECLYSKFILATSIGAMPQVLFAVYIGMQIDTFVNYAEEETSPAEVVLTSFLVVVFVMLIVYINRESKRELKVILDEEERVELQDGVSSTPRESTGATPVL